MAQTYLNAKQERYAQFLAEGNTQAEAYVLAGYEPSAANASTLANKPIVKERVAVLKQEHERKEMEFRLLRERAEGSDPEFAAAIAKGAEWNFQRVMDLMGENVRLAQMAGEYKAANECLKMMGESMKMFEGAKAKEAPAGGSLAFVKNLTQIMADVPIPAEESDNPLRPRAPIGDA